MAQDKVTAVRYELKAARQVAQHNTDHALDLTPRRAIEDFVAMSMLAERADKHLDAAGMLASTASIVHKVLRAGGWPNASLLNNLAIAIRNFESGEPNHE